ncbi:hypothetical protein V2H45_10495 [Tumidithrix elongata RA019]|uniref:DUF1579 domain-containing protein n=1 Tax=Tumidithrix elongata BACA0141 TaxID=2716417 RepID=A0AAW9Q163_9CYAN|nr:hypothetical protein [Tumidithrix elongata RA019]
MAHTFLMQPGRWSFEGSWLDREALAIPVKGRTLVGWSKDNFWFTMVTELTFPDSDRAKVTLTYRGRIDADERRFTFVLEHSEMGRVEGEGLVAPDSIVQRYWVMGDKKMRTGFQTLYKQDADRYLLSSGIVGGQNLESTMEAVLTRQH